ncbi:ABC transporter ATP-binding protein [Candidatus Saccharibacteria bacterium]|nr:ABC transporter ATP-binding protein [Candidatus Saccharibacteria bacterium]
MSEIVTLHDVVKTYKKGDQPVKALKNVSLTIAEGESVAIMGPSGSGKSTLLQLLGSLDKPTSGDIQIDGKSPQKLSDAERSKFRKNTIGFVFQQFYLQPFLSALDNVALPMRLNGMKAKPARAAASELLENVGLAAKTKHAPSELSGGEMQRVAIARAMANNPKILLADEPTGNLDRKNADSIVELFQKLRVDGTTVIVVTHDEKVANAFQRVIHIENGSLQPANINTQETAPVLEEMQA